MGEQIIADVLKRAEQDPQWLKEGGEFIPYPSTYLNGDRWEDATESPTRRSDELPTNVGQDR